MTRSFNRKKYARIAFYMLFSAVFVCAFSFAHTFPSLKTDTNFASYAQAKQSFFPFYDLRPQELCVRAEFSTSYKKSSKERKWNVLLAAKSINDTFLDVGEEFSFNTVVGARTEKRGYKSAKIIVGGEFVDGIGGGVCQVSTTLYNAALLSGLSITEFHAHSLPVSYVAPSFDAMVNSGSADLRFINNTHNPILISAFADGETLKIIIVGEPLKQKIVRKSVITGTIPAPEEERVFDDNFEYPDLFIGESKVVSYSKPGIKSEGFLVFYNGEKSVFTKKIRVDKYAPRRGLIVQGRAVKPIVDEDFNFPFSNLIILESI